MELALTGKFSPAALGAIPAYLMRKEPIIPTNETCYDLLGLAHSLQDPELVQSIQAAVRQNPTQLLVPALNFAFDNTLDQPVEFEAALKSNLLNIPGTELAKLRLAVLTRNFSFPQPSNVKLFQKSFDVALELCRTQGPQYSVLFKGVNRLSLSPAQSNSLESLDGFLWQFLDCSSLESYDNQLRELTERVGLLETRRLCERLELQAGSTGSESGLNTDLLTQDIRELKDSVVNSMIALRKDVDVLKSQIREIVERHETGIHDLNNLKSQIPQMSVQIQQELELRSDEVSRLIDLEKGLRGQDIWNQVFGKMQCGLFSRQSNVLA
jgi:hypothetical protein